MEELNEILKEETDKELVELAQEDLKRLLEEEKEIAEEANRISLPSNT